MATVAQADVVQATVQVSILVVCLGAAVFLSLRSRRAADGPDDLGGTPATVPAPQPTPPPALAPARPAPVAPPVEIVQTCPEQPVPAAPMARRARANSGFTRFDTTGSRVRTGRA